MTSAAPAFATARDTRPCATCGTPVDPLRAERVAYVRDRFRYFCSVACRERFDIDPHLTPLPLPRRAGERLGLRTPLPTPLPTPVPERHSPTPRTVSDGPRRASTSDETERPSRTTRRSRHPPPTPAASSETRGPGASGLLLTLAGLGSGLALGLTLAGAAR